MLSFRDKLKFGILSGAKKGWSGFVWMIKILVPISFFTMLLNYSGLLNKADFLLEPAMRLLSLPPAAALPLIVGMLTGIYGGIAAMIMLPLSVNDMTLIAVFLLISHNLIQEGIVQGKSGMNPLKATLFRLIASVVTVMAVAYFLDTGPGTAAVAKNVSVSSVAPFMVMLKVWLRQTAYLCVKIFFIVMTLMLVLGVMKSFNLVPHIVKALNPLLKIMGLNQRAGILWLTAVVFGLAYGAAVIVEEVKEGSLSPEELTRLHLSIGINHSMVEDPTLFLSLGLSAFWLWIPRLITAIVAVHLFFLWHRMKKRKSSGLLHESAN
ncbi:MAG: iron transporter [Desulfobacteraceae bacterium IS3]|nr:MAG: iron transporter [Desulfobacteraceae bacterium IS3]